MKDAMTDGTVSLVGAGPGDPELISVKGLRLIQSADAVVYDRLVDKRLLDHARANAEMYDVGKIPGKRINRQEDINKLLVELGSAGKRVVRLKGGDPFVFGRGGEEAEALANAGLPFEIVPGITSAIAAPAYAGIPITQRRVASSFTVVTGSEDPTKPDTSVDWETLAKSSDTIAVLMGQSNLRVIAAALVDYGRSPETPVALVQWGTEPYQRTLVGTLANIADEAAAAGIGAPAVTVIGDVVKLREAIRWFDSRPLFGKRMLITRTRTQSSALSALLTQRGAIPVELPTIEIQPMEDYAELDDALASAQRYDWAVFSSANAVDIVFDRLPELGIDARALHGVSIAAIGPATRRRLRERGIVADFMPSSFVADVAVDELGALGVEGKRVLLPQAQIARDTLRVGLAEHGADVQSIAVYRTVTPQNTAERLQDILADGIDIATFTSSSTATNLVELMDGNTDALKNATIACIGPITAERAAELGFAIDIVSAEHTIAGLVSAVESHFTEEAGQNE